MEVQEETQLNKWGHTWIERKSEVDPRNGRTWRHHWQSTNGNLVRVFPPDSYYSSWFVEICNSDGSSTGQGRDIHELTGSDAEDRAFCIAEGYTRQER